MPIACAYYIAGSRPLPGHASSGSAAEAGSRGPDRRARCSPILTTPSRSTGRRRADRAAGYPSLRDRDCRGARWPAPHAHRTWGSTSDGMTDSMNRPMRMRPGSRSHQLRKVSPDGRAGAVWIARPWNRDCVQERGRVTDCWVRPPNTARRADSMSRGPRSPTSRRFQPHESADARWYANGTTAIAALGNRKQARRDRGRRAARTAGHPGRVPGRTRRRADVGLGIARQAELWRRGLAEADRAGRAEHFDDVVVDRRYEIRIAGRPQLQ